MIAIYVGRDMDNVWRVAQELHPHRNMLVSSLGLRLPVFCTLHPLDQMEETRKAVAADDFIGVCNSCFVLDEVPCDRIFVVSKDIVRPLSDHPDWKNWVGMLRPGEFWSQFDDSWLSNHLED